MTTCENAAQQQYRRAPLNGLIIGVIAGVCWVVVLRIPDVLPGSDGSGNVRLDLVAIAFPVLGWISGLWGRKVLPCGNPADRGRRALTIGVVMSTLLGILLTIVYHGFVPKPKYMEMPAGTALSGRAFVVYLIPLTVFILAGWVLGKTREHIYMNGGSVILRMGFMAVLVLMCSVILWNQLVWLLILLIFPWTL